MFTDKSRIFCLVSKKEIFNVHIIKNFNRNNTGMSWLIFSIVVIISSYLGDDSIYKNKTLGKWCSYLFRTILIFSLSYLIGFGGQTGTDHLPYANLYKSTWVSDFDFHDTFKIGHFYHWSEPGFIALNKVIWMLGFGEAGYFFIIALLTNFFFVSVFYRFKFPVLAFVIYITSIYYNQQMNLVRQMLAVSIFLYALKFFEEKKLVKYVVFILAASLIHYSSIFLLLLLLLYKIDLKPENTKLTITILSLWLISIIVSLLGNINLSWINIGGVYSKYFTGAGSVGTVATFNVFFNFFTLIYFWLYRKLNMNVYCIIFVIGCIVLNISVSFNNLIRFSYFFTPLYCAFVPTMMINCIKSGVSIAKPILWMTGLYYISTLILYYILNPFQIMGSEMYDWSEFFR